MSKNRLHKRDLDKDPFAQFSVWFAVARLKSGLPNPNAFALATQSPAEGPSVRIVLLKAVDSRGFVFYSNFESEKGKAILAEPRVELDFHWDILGRQVRVRGLASPVDDEEADAYFATRARASQLGAWASQQSREAASRKAMEKRLSEVEKLYEGKDVPRPPYWSGFRVAPQRFEFWQADPDRLHDRFQYSKEDGHWKIRRIYP